MNVKDFLRDLGSCFGVSGYERAFSERLREMLRVFCVDASIDKFNNVIAVKKCGRDGAKRLMLEAHLDQIGLMVSNIDKNGFISFVNLGGVDERILPASEVYILGRERVFGVIGAKPPHLSGAKEKGIKIENMLIDTGFTRDALMKIIPIGSPIVMKSGVGEMQGEKLCGCAMDNRGGVASVFYCLEKIRDMDLDFDLYVLFSSQEELGLHGAYSGTYEIDPDLAVAVDVTHGTTSDTKGRCEVFDLGSGAVICRGPSLDFERTNQLIQAAKENALPYEIETAAGNSGTTSWAIQTSRLGVPVMLVSVPLRYMHTTVETLCVRDVECVGDLLSKFVSGGGIFA